jgi:hypothetical protein
MDVAKIAQLASFSVSVFYCMCCSCKFLCNTESHKLHLTREVCGFFMPVGLYLQTTNDHLQFVKINHPAK